MRSTSTTDWRLNYDNRHWQHLLGTGFNSPGHAHDRAWTCLFLWWSGEEKKCAFNHDAVFLSFMPGKPPVDTVWLFTRFWARHWPRNRQPLVAWSDQCGKRPQP